MTERYYTDGTEPDVLPHYSRCTGPCDQGRKKCPCPAACEAQDDDGVEAIGLLACLGIAVIGIVGLVAFLIGRYA